MEMKRQKFLQLRFVFFMSLVALIGFIPPVVRAETQEIRNLSNRRYLEPTLEAIQKAKQSIFLVMYHLPLDPSNKSSPVTRLMDALIQVKNRGVRVRVILDQEIKTERSTKGAPMKNLRAFHVLKENGISVSFDSLGKRTHAKLLVIDEETVILGSTNWSREALDQNYEANLLVRSPEMAKFLLEDFKTIELLQPERTVSSQGTLRISRSFLLDKNQGPRLLEEHAERALRVYLILISHLTPSLRAPHKAVIASPSRLSAGEATPSPIYASKTHGPYRPKIGDGAIPDSEIASSPRQYEMGGTPRNDERNTALRIDYEETAKLLGMEHRSREAYRRQIIKVLKKLDRDYKLIRLEPRHGKEASVTLLNPKRGQAPFEIPKEDYFEIPREFFAWGWLTALSLRAQYSLLILYDQASYPRTSPTIKVALETLEKRYFVSKWTLGLGFKELARQGLLEIYYGKATDFKKREFETTSYVLLPFYNPKLRDEELRKLETLYGKEAFQQAQVYAQAFFKEKDPAVIETLLGLRWTYSPEWLDLAMNKIILKKKVGNPARSLPYLIGILKAWKEKGRPVLP